MKQEQQRTFDSYRRVQDFLDAHADQVGALKDSAGRKQLDDVVTQVAAQDNAQSSANLAMSGQISREKSLTDDLKDRHMRPITVFARARLRGVPDFAALTKPTSGLSSRSLVRAARAMATAAAPHANEFQSGGLPADTVQQLADAATAVDTVLSERANTAVGRVQATNGIGEELTKGKEAVGMLSAVIMRQFAGDPTFLAAWRAARRVPQKRGRTRTSSVAPPPSPSPSPSPSPVPPATSQLRPPTSSEDPQPHL